MIKLFKNKYLWLSLILIGAFVVRLYKIESPIADWHSWRQADTASVSKAYVERGINLLFPRYHDVSSIQTGIPNPEGYRFVELPVYNAAHALLAKTFPVLSLEVWGRLLSIFCVLVSTVLLFWLGQRFIGSLGGVLAAFFFAFIPYNIYFSRVILPEPMGVAFGLLAIVLFVKFIDSGKNKHLYLSGIAFAIALLIKPFAVFYGVPLLYLALKKYGIEAIIKKPSVLISFLIFTDIVIVPLLLWRAWMTNYPVGVPFFIWAFNGDGIRFRPAFWRWIFAERLGSLILGIWGISLFVLGILTKAKNNKFVRLFLLGMFFYVSVVATANVRHDYYQIFIIPAVSLALAQGANYLLSSKSFSKTVSWGVLGFSVLMMLAMGWYKVKEYYKVNHPEIIEAGRAVDALVEKDALIIAPYNGDTAFLYQTNRWGWPAIENSIDNIIFRGADYYVSVTPGDADTQMIVKRFEVIKETPTYLIADLHKPKKGVTK